MGSMRGHFEYVEGRRINKTILLILLFIAANLSFTPLHAEDKTKSLIGAVEEVVLFPWGVKLPARIDTGASMTSLDVRDLTIKNKVAEFRLPEKYENVLIKLPVLRHCNIRSSGFRERRPVVEIELCVGSKRLRVEVNLSNRSHLEYPLIIGRNVLGQGFIVDPAREKVASPNCLEEASK